MKAEVHGWESAYRKRHSGEREPHEDAGVLDAFFRKQSVRTILDLGCGDGRDLVHLAKLGYDMYGLDIAPTGLRRAGEWLASEGLSVALVASDMTDIPWHDGFFDACISIQVINHHRIKEIRRTIQEIWRVLRPGGYLFVTVGIDRPRRMTVEGKRVEVEPWTYVRLDGHENGVPHHCFNEEELRGEFSAFKLLEEVLPLHRDSRRKACFLAQKPRA